MSISALKKLVPPPDRPVQVGTLDRWREIERSIGIRFPRDYRDLVFCYGADLFAGLYYVFSPFASDYLETVQRKCDILRESRETEGADYVPYPIHPEPNGLLPWGGDENGNEYCWLTEGSPTKWPVVQNAVRGSGFQLHQCGITEFFTAIMERRIPALASGYPPIILRCPVETCIGWVRGGDDVSWYCESCSYEWDEREDFNEAIAEIIAQRPYRAACYVKNGDNYEPAPRKQEPADYELLVEAELDE